MSETGVVYNKGKVYKRAITSSLGFFCMGYFLNIFNSSQTCVSRMLGWGDDEEILIAITTAIGPFGALFGVLSAGYLTKYYGKRSLLIYTDILTIIGSILTYIPNTFTFGIGRFTVGFTSGNYSTICSQYTSEFTPPDVYSKIGFIGPINGVVATFIATLVCVPLPDKCEPSDKFFIFAIYLVPGFVALIQLLMLLKVFKKESPKWLLMKQNYSLALHSYESIFNREFAETEIKKIKTLEGVDEQKYIQNTQEYTYINLICCKKGTTKGMRLGTLIHMANQLSGIPIIMFYSTLLYQDIGEGIFLARILTAAGAFVRIPPVILLLPHVPKVSAKSLNILGHVIMGSNLLIISFLVGIPEMMYLIVVNIYVYLVVFGCTLFPICWAYTSQVMPDKGMSLGAGVQWAMCALIVLFFPFLIGALGIRFSFLLFAGLNFLSVAYLFFDMVDIRGKSKQEIKEMFSQFR